MKRWLTALLVLPALTFSAGQARADSGSVTNVRLEANAGRAELTIEVTGDFRWSDFQLSDPARLVIDVGNARSSLPAKSFDGIDRGGVEAVRTSQFRADVVRLVVDLERTTAYRVERVPEGLRISLAGSAQAFQPWSAAESGAYAAELPAFPQQTASAAPAVQQQRQQQSQARRITVNFFEADIRDVLDSFAEFTGRSIIPGRGVEGTITANINDQPWDIALRELMGAYGYAVQELPSGIIRVDNLENLATARTQEPLVTQTFRINYVPVGELVETLTPMKTERGQISANPSTNTLIFTDVAGVVDNIARLIGQLDTRTAQVAIQAKIVFVNRTDVEELGVTYDLKDSRGNSLNRLVSVPDPNNPGEFTNQDLVLLGGSSIAALGNANARISGASLETVISLVLGRYTLVTFLDALQTAELSDVQASPLVTTLSNQEANILVGERTPIRVVDLGSPTAAAGAGGAVARATTELVETGIKLRVTPYVTADRRILLQLRAERSSAQLAATEIGVLFQTQEASTRLLVNDGETAVIGGLTVTEVTQTRAGIPILMDLPIVGALFRTTRSREQKRDLLIMVTPHIVEERIS
ncbi:MAG: AMIN domain-containing protein [Longimicrobiaceae bacterium]